jgi:ATP phosphoribosyltransferase regulatory subunit HisZ
MDYKNVDEMLKKMNLTPEELEKHRELIGECRQRELQNEETSKRNKEAFPKLIKNYQEFFASMGKVYQAIGTLEEKTKEALKNSGKSLEAIKESTVSVKKLTGKLYLLILKETLKNSETICKYFDGKDSQN